MARECATLAKPLNKYGGTEGMWSNPCNPQSINLQHSLPDPNPKPTHMKEARRKGQQQVTPIPFLNLDPIAHLVGCSNKAPVIIGGQEVTAFIDLGAHVSNISAQFLKSSPCKSSPWVSYWS